MHGSSLLETMSASQIPSFYKARRASMGGMGKKAKPSLASFSGLLSKEAVEELARAIEKMREEDLASQKRRILVDLETTYGADKVMQVRNLLERTKETGKTHRQVASELGIPYGDLRLVAAALGLTEPE